MHEPRRHAAGDRNREKALKQIGRIQRELEYLTARLRRLIGHLDYTASKADKLRNRLVSEKKR
jgi:hypothetical protein